MVAGGYTNGIFAHLHCHSCYSFLDGGSYLETLVRRAAWLGQPAIALTDHDNTAAAVKFTELCCDQYGIKPLLGAELTMENGSHLTLLASNRNGYANICTLIAKGYEAGGRLTPALPWSALNIDDEQSKIQSLSSNVVIGDPKSKIEGVICLSGCRKGILSQLIKNHRYKEAAQTAKQLKDRFPDGFWIELQDDLTPGSHRICRELADLADHLKIGVVATNNVHYATQEDYIAHDLLRCVATKTTREEPHPDKPLNSERYLKSAQEMAELFDWRRDAITNTIRIAESCESALPEKQDVTPAYILPKVTRMPPPICAI